MTMKAGFAKAEVTPPVGGHLEGLGVAAPIAGVHDPLFVRCVYLEQPGRGAALIVGCDLLFFERADVDRFKGAIGRAMGLAPAQVLLNTSHNHAGPRLTRWAYEVHGGAVDPLYVEQIERALTPAAVEAKAAAREVRVEAGMTRTDLPLSRRQPDAQGRAQWKPWKAGPVCDALPVCLLRGADGGVVALLFSVSCHPSMWYEPLVSADYPGVAQRRLNERFGTEGALFLQGAGGDTKPRYVADGEERWRHGRWEEVEAAGRDVADAVIRLVEGGLPPHEPDLRCHYEETMWPMGPLPSRAGLEAELADAGAKLARRRWAADMLARLDRFGELPSAVPVGLHAVQLARGVRLIGLEGESVAELGLLTLRHYDRGVTFPLGYTNGAQLYLPVARMHREKGYEVESYYEYHWPAELLPVEDSVVSEALERLQRTGAIPNG